MEPFPFAVKSKLGSIGAQSTSNMEYGVLKDSTISNLLLMNAFSVYFSKQSEADPLTPNLSQDTHASKLLSKGEYRTL